MGKPALVGDPIVDATTDSKCRVERCGSRGVALAMLPKPALSERARVTTAFRSAPGHRAASFSDPIKRLLEIGLGVGASRLGGSCLSTPAS